MFSTIYSVYARIAPIKGQFFLVFFVMMLVSYGVLFLVDFIPEPLSEETQVLRAEKEAQKTEESNIIIKTINAINGGLSPTSKGSNESGNDSGLKVTIPEKATTTPEGEVAQEVSVATKPIHITFDSLGTSVAILNPTSRSVADLDAALLEGAVRHPDSADFGNEGNIFILGHSSYLPNVFNKNFQAFNGLQNLIWGDTIRLDSEDTEYIYRVDRVYKAKASAVTVPNTRGEAKLTLATCNSFGSKDDRFIVEATLVSTKTL